MAKNFSQSDIDEFRDCYNLYARSKILASPQELTMIIRSLGFSPSEQEAKSYFEKYQRDGKIEFSVFLEIIHEHSQKEKCQQEIMEAFQAQDRGRTGTVPSQDLYHVLTNFGEKLSKAEVDRLFKEANIPARGNAQYAQILKTLLTPLPDY